MHRESTAPTTPSRRIVRLGIAFCCVLALALMMPEAHAGGKGKDKGKGKGHKKQGEPKSDHPDDGHDHPHGTGEHDSDGDVSEGHGHGHAKGKGKGHAQGKGKGHTKPRRSDGLRSNRARSKRDRALQIAHVALNKEMAAARKQAAQAGDPATLKTRMEEIRKRHKEQRAQLIEAYARDLSADATSAAKLAGQSEAVAANLRALRDSREKTNRMVEDSYAKSVAALTKSTTDARVLEASKSRLRQQTELAKAAARDAYILGLEHVVDAIPEPAPVRAR